MNAVYSSRTFGGDKRRAWEAVVSQLYASMDVQVRGVPEFQGEITHCLLDDLDLTHVIADYEIASRRRRHIARDVRQSCVFLFVKKGPMTLEQFGREALLDANSCSLVDLASPYVLKHAGVTDTFFLKAPEVVLRSKFKDIHSHCAVARPIGPGMGSIAADMIASLVQNASEAGEQGAAYLATQILDILALAFEAAPTDMPEGPSLAQAAGAQARACLYRSPHQRCGSRSRHGRRCNRRLDALSPPCLRVVGNICEHAHSCLAAPARAGGSIRREAAPAVDFGDCHPQRLCQSKFLRDLLQKGIRRVAAKRSRAGAPAGSGSDLRRC